MARNCNKTLFTELKQLFFTKQGHCEFISLLNSCSFIKNCEAIRLHQSAKRTRTSMNWLCNESILDFFNTHSEKELHPRLFPHFFFFLFPSFFFFLLPPYTPQPHH